MIIKRLLLTVVIFISVSAHGQETKKDFIISSGAYVSSLYNSSGYYFSIESTWENDLNFSLKTAFTDSDDYEGLHTLMGVNWVLVPFSKIDDSFFNTESYLGFYPLSVEKFTHNTDDDEIENAFAPSIFIGYKLIFWSKLVLDMYAGGNVALRLGDSEKESTYSNKTAGIGIGIKF